MHIEQNKTRNRFLNASRPRQIHKDCCFANVKKIQFNIELLFQLRELVIKYSMLLDQRNINI